MEAKRTIMAIFLLMMMSCAFGMELSEYSHVEYTYGWRLEEYYGNENNPTIAIVKVYFLAKEDLWFKDLMEFISTSDEYYLLEGYHGYVMDKDVFEELQRRVKGF